jgi:hypothetical protein
LTCANVFELTRCRTKSLFAHDDFPVMFAITLRASAELCRLSCLPQPKTRVCAGRRPELALPAEFADDVRMKALFRRACGLVLFVAPLSLAHAHPGHFGGHGEGFNRVVAPIDATWILMFVVGSLVIASLYAGKANRE